MRNRKMPFNSHWIKSLMEFEMKLNDAIQMHWYRNNKIMSFHQAVKLPPNSLNFIKFLSKFVLHSWIIENSENKSSMASNWSKALKIIWCIFYAKKNMKNREKAKNSFHGIDKWESAALISIVYKWNGKFIEIRQQSDWSATIYTLQMNRTMLIQHKLMRWIP